MLHSRGFGRVDDKEADVDVVVDDQVFCKLQERDEVAYTRGWEEGDMRLCDHFFRTHHFRDF